MVIVVIYVKVYCRWLMSMVIVDCHFRLLLSMVRERPFNLKGGGGVCFFSKNIFWFPMLLKKIFWFWWRKKNSDSEFLSYDLMLNFGKKIRALCDKKKNILTLVLSKKKFWTKQKNKPPPLQVKLSVPYCRYICRCLRSMVDVDGYCKL